MCSTKIFWINCLVKKSLKKRGKFWKKIVTLATDILDDFRYKMVHYFSQKFYMISLWEMSTLRITLQKNKPKPKRLSEPPFSHIQHQTQTYPASHLLRMSKNYFNFWKLNFVIKNFYDDGECLEMQKRSRIINRMEILKSKNNYLLKKIEN